jgi:nucleoside-diphosphate-sugar epimerase
MIFVTGGTGLLGSHILFDLVKRGERVRALKRAASTTERVRKVFSFYSDKFDLLFEKIEWVEGDILDYDSLLPLLDGINQIYHAAAIVSFDTRNRAAIIRDNTEGTANIVNAAIEKGGIRICHVSSIAALGNPPEGEAADEDHVWTGNSNRSAYSESKFLSEMEVWRGIYHGLEAVIINPSIILGPGNWNSGSSAIFKAVGDGLKFYTRGSSGFVDVRDVSRAACSLMDAGNWERVKNQRFIISAENIKFRDAFNMMADALETERPKIYAGDFLLALAWRFSRVASWFTGKAPVMTKESVRSSSQISLYDGSKISSFIDFKYTPVSKSISDTVSIFLNENRHKQSHK